MKLNKLKIKNFRRLKDIEIIFGDATFLIGANNMGKSSVLEALKYLHSNININDQDYYYEMDEDNQKINEEKEVIFEVEYKDIPFEADNWRGFKGRVYEEDIDNKKVRKIKYRKTYSKTETKPKIEMLELKKSIKENFKKCNKFQDYIDNGIKSEVLIEVFGKIENFNKKLGKKDKENLENLFEIYDYENEKTWSKNPGGIPQNVLSKLPKVLIIPANDKYEDIEEKNGVLKNIMNELFEEVRDESSNYKKAKEFLDELAKEMNPNNEETKLGKLLNNINKNVNKVFPGANIKTDTNFSDPNKTIKPIFDVELGSNVFTKVQNQGNGMIRTVVFSLLKFREDMEKSKNTEFKRDLIIGFEEPEIYLHPNAANQLRNNIYELSEGSSQIVCTTHSPYMIDLSRKPRQILNNLSFFKNLIINKAINISDEFLKLQINDKSYIKMLSKLDDYISRVFFANSVIIVEGDTDEIVLKKVIDLQDEDLKNKIYSDVQIVKARGKATIISLLKYLKSLGIKCFVIHDRDSGVKGAEKYNEPILEQLERSEDLRILCEECVEDELGYTPPNCEKPFKAYKYIESWNKKEDIPHNLNKKLEKLWNFINI